MMPLLWVHEKYLNNSFQFFAELGGFWPKARIVVFQQVNIRIWTIRTPFHLSFGYMIARERKKSSIIPIYPHNLSTR